MAFQQPAFMVSHPAAAIEIGDIDVRFNTDPITDDTKRSLIDRRQGESASFTATGNSSGIKFDLLSASLINCWVLPAGHTMNGFRWDLWSDDHAGLSSPTNQASLNLQSLAFLAPAGVEVAFPSNITDRWWFFQSGTTGTETFTLGEFWIGNRKALTAGDSAIETGFAREYVHNVSEDNFGGRTATLELSPVRRTFSLQVQNLDPSGTDFATLDEVMRDGRTKPFWYWTPDSTDTGPYLVKLISAATRAQSSSVPIKSSRYAVALEMIEQIT